MKFSVSCLASIGCIIGSASAAPAVEAKSSAAACATTLSSSIAKPSVAAGYTARLVANGLTSPRGIAFDTAGHLLVVQQGVGVVALTLDNEAGSCVTSSSKKTVITDSTLNHGITFSADGATLFVSSQTSVFQYGYTASSASTTGTGTVIITNMTNTDHSTRTLRMSKFAANTIIVSRGSGNNLDPISADETSGRAQIRAFDLSARTGVYEYQNSGKLLGWGLRNDVGIDEHPVTGGLYSVENSADDITRNGVDIHNTNPGEEMNYLGTLVNNKSPNQGSNFGYPNCFSVWNKSSLPDNSDLKVGQQFAIGTITATNNDAMCKAYTPAVAVFHPHFAPLDLLFNADGSQAFVTFHGSWDSTTAVGYQVGVVNFANGVPKTPTTSRGAATPVFENPNTAACYNTACVRPVGLAWDPNGQRLFFSSDATGEIWVLTKNKGF